MLKTARGNPLLPDNSETQILEFKESWRDEYLRTVCAFANSTGGKLIIGKDDNGNPVGLKNSKRLLEDIPNKIKEILGILVDVNIRRQAENEFIEIVVEPYFFPVSYKGEYFLRVGSTSQTLKGAALNRFLLKRQGMHWDSLPLPGLSFSMLNLAAIEKFRSLALRNLRIQPDLISDSVENLLEKLHLFDGKMLKRAAALLFFDDPERFVAGTFIKIGYFENNVDLRYQDEVHGNLFQQLEKTVEILRTKYLKAWISYRGLHRIETLCPPEPALREALLNAVAHKDYSSGSPIQISVYPHRMMIWNSSQLLPDQNLANLLKKHSSQPFNPDLANTFFRAGMVELWGRGIDKMIESCRAESMPEPEFAVEANGFWVTFRFADEKVAGGKITPKTTPKTSAAQIIIELIEENPEITRKEMAALSGLTLDGVKYHLHKLKTAGKIRHTGPARSGRWQKT